MENEIKVGEYCRTDNGIIGKYVKYRGIEDTIETNNKWIGFDIEKDIVKHSEDIIDLIKKDDYVNGCKVYENHKTFLTVYQKVKDSEVDYNYINCDEIETIVTKEMMESISYKVERKDITND